MSEFKQIIGRGTRVRDDYGKLFFSIIDYTGSATRLFADPGFDGEPIEITEGGIDEPIEPPEPPQGPVIVDPPEPPEPPESPEPPTERRKFYYDEGYVDIAAHMVYELDPDGKQLYMIKFTDYTADKIRSFYRNAADLRNGWANPAQRKEIIEKLAEYNIDFEELAKEAGQPDADPLDLLCHLAFNAPLRTRRERAQRLRSEKKDFFERFRPEARQVLDELLEKYTDHGTAQFLLPDALELHPISEHGNPMEIAELFGGPEQLRDAVNELQTLLYAA
jgi:type I restriction enzyme R subunit